MDNSVLESLKSRRSIRKYKQEPIKKEELEAILEAGTYAPTAMGNRGRTAQSFFVTGFFA